jgi:pimeloyl-ACP methyl ester carboxylesterase
METSRTIHLPQGTIQYRDTGEGPPIVFVHGLLVDGLLWRKVTPELEGEYRCIVPDWPFGAHRRPLAPDADRSPRGMAHLAADFLDALQLERVTLVANDTGGAIAQLLVTERPARIGRLVLTPCDCYENYLPPAFRPLEWGAHIPGAFVVAAQAARIAAVRRSRLGFGLLVKRPIPDDVSRGWLEPLRESPAIRRDAIGLLRGIDKRDTLAAAKKLRDFEGPTLLAWAREDVVFKLRYAERLAQDIPGSRLELIDDSQGFVPEDQPQRLAELIGAFAREA